jgi:hypothetical protein
MFPEESLKNIPDGHPIFTIFHKILTNQLGLKAIMQNQRIVLIYSDRDIGCSWGSVMGCDDGCNTLSRLNSFKLVCNIIIYVLRE